MSPTVTMSEKKNLALDAEAKRLIDFKRQNIKKKDLTPCPQCTTLVNIHANKCPHCASSIAEHTRRIREELKKLDELTYQMFELHKREMEIYQQEVGSKPFWVRIKDFFDEPQVIQDLKIVLPSLVSFFVLVLFLRGKSVGLIFWLVSLVGGFLIYSLFKKWNLKKYITVDLYRTVLVFGMVIILVSSLGSTGKFWPDISFMKSGVEVQSSSAIVRVSPAANADIATTVYQGENLKVLGKRGAWYKVTTESGRTGWIHSSVVK